MIDKKSKLQKYLSLFTPTSLGMVFYIFLSGLTIVMNQFETIKKYLELPQNFQFSRIFASWADSALTATIGQTRTETLVVGLFWAVVGLVVYLFLRSLSRMAEELDDDLSVRGYVWPKGTNRYRPLKEFLEKAGFRFVALIALALVISGPLAATIRGPVFIDFLGPNIVIQYAVWLLAGLFMWHVVTILIRLVALRARLFG